MPIQKTQREERPPAPVWLLFLCFLSSPLSLPYVNWASQEGCLFFTRGPRSGPQTFLCPVSEGFSLPCLLATAILDSFVLF